jgi:hypothetical protein
MEDEKVLGPQPSQPEKTYKVVIDSVKTFPHQAIGAFYAEHGASISDALCEILCMAGEYNHVIRDVIEDNRNADGRSYTVLMVTVPTVETKH